MSNEESNPNEVENKSESTIGSVSVKPPIFDESCCNGWFRIVEAQFLLAKVTLPSTKFYIAISALPAKVVSKLSSNLWDSQDYGELKRVVIGFFEQSKSEIFENLISNTTMSGKPSQYLEELKSQAQQVGIGMELVRHKFLQAQSPTISAVLASHENISLDDLGRLADQILPLTRRQPVFDTIQAAQTTAADNGVYIPISLRPFSSNQRPKVCRSHLYFGSRARSCKPWCAWPIKPNSLQIQPTSRSVSRESSPSGQPEN